MTVVQQLVETFRTQALTLNPTQGQAVSPATSEPTTVVSAAISDGSELVDGFATLLESLEPHRERLSIRFSG
ncbi:hypothetical protein DV706_12440 [Natronorubrum bangense]|nr:hypothetical protein DV706_12440 [Natronorubrum bangense]